jgi:hypothetical protein
MNYLSPKIVLTLLTLVNLSIDAQLLNRRRGMAHTKASPSPAVADPAAASAHAQRTQEVLTELERLQKIGTFDKCVADRVGGCRVWLYHTTADLKDSLRLKEDHLTSSTFQKHVKNLISTVAFLETKEQHASAINLAQKCPAIASELKQAVKNLVRCQENDQSNPCIAEQLRYDTLLLCKHSCPEEEELKEITPDEDLEKIIKTHATEIKKAEELLSFLLK